MKKGLFPFVLLSCLVYLVSGLSMAQESDALDNAAIEESEEEDSGKTKSSKSKKTKKGAAARKSTAGKPEPSAVMQALKEFKMIAGKPNANADYYVYLYSASWCGFCRECMPVAVEQYKQMRRTRKVEVILICGDKSVPEAKDYIRSCRAKFPTMMFSELQATQFRGLPSCGMPGFPAVTVVTKDGKMMTNVVGAGQVKDVLENWKSYTIDREENN